MCVCVCVCVYEKDILCGCEVVFLLICCNFCNELCSFFYESAIKKIQLLLDAYLVCMYTHPCCHVLLTHTGGRGGYPRWFAVTIKMILYNHTFFEYQLLVSMHVYTHLEEVRRN